ncbi:MAG TPA: hypothetical protein VG500_17705 [Gemmatimonadales bacterium]|jgi:hypothetical protein|nr:hypothetical protein [Gemmatimonadales bacterium]
MFHLTASRNLIGGSAAVLVLALAACGDDPTDNGGGPGEQEVITEVSLTLTPQGGGTAQTATITDPDGIGAQNPEPQEGTLVLTPGTSYDGTVTFTDATKTPPEDITAEVEEEGDAHRVFYTVDAAHAATVTVTDLDTDANNAPLGLSYTVNAAAGAVSGTDGTIRVVLSHYDDTPKGDGSTPSLESDVDQTFEFSIE